MRLIVGLAATLVVKTALGLDGQKTKSDLDADAGPLADRNVPELTA